MAAFPLGERPLRTIAIREQRDIKSGDYTHDGTPDYTLRFKLEYEL